MKFPTHMLWILFAAYLIGRFGLHYASQSVLRKIRRRLEDQHPDWDLRRDRTMWTLLIFHQRELPDDPELRHLATVYRRFHVAILILALVISAALIALLVSPVRTVSLGI